MKYYLSLFFCLISVGFVRAQDSALAQVLMGKFLDSMEQTLHYQYGQIRIADNKIVINIPDGFKFLDGPQANKVLEEIWGNPKSEVQSLGMILPVDQRIMTTSNVGYVFNIQYEEGGHIKDDDAEDIDYDDLLKEMKTDAVEENKKRTSGGYPAIDIVGWASKPFYDNNQKILHWAKELKFGNEPGNTLNYNIRFLGRNGTLLLNAVAQMPSLPLVQKDINQVIGMVHFTPGNEYKDFNPGVDKVAAITIGGLIAGKVLAKVGFLALIVKFWKIIALAVAGFFGFIWKRFKRKKEEEQGNDFGGLPPEQNLPE